MAHETLNSRLLCDLSLSGAANYFVIFYAGESKVGEKNPPGFICTIKILAFECPSSQAIIIFGVQM